MRAPFGVLVLGGGPDALAAVELAGGEVAAALDWADPLDGASARVLTVEAAGADAELLAAALPPVAALAEAGAVSVVVALEAAQLDAVAAELLGARIHLLPDPTMEERVTALLLAAREADKPPAGFVGETDGERLRGLADDLQRVADALSRYAGREQPTGGTIADRTTGYGAPPDDPGAPRIDPAEVRRVIRARRLRDKAFGARVFEDPAWDILLDLFAASLEEAQVSVSSLCIAAAVAPTTALRWIGRMTADGLLVRTRDAFDKRRALMSLSPRAAAGMRGYVASLHAAGLPFV